MLHIYVLGYLKLLYRMPIAVFLLHRYKCRSTLVHHFFFTAFTFRRWTVIITVSYWRGISSWSFSCSVSDLDKMSANCCTTLLIVHHCHPSSIHGFQGQGYLVEPGVLVSIWMFDSLLSRCAALELLCRVVTSLCQIHPCSTTVFDLLPCTCI